MNRIRMMLVAGLILTMVSLIQAEDKVKSDAPMLLSIYHSNDFMGYLTPCG